MPNLNKFTLRLYDKFRVDENPGNLGFKDAEISSYEDQKRTKFEENINLSNLKCLKVESYGGSLIEFFAKFLKQNSLIKFSNNAGNASDTQSIKENLQIFFSNQKLIKNFKTESSFDFIGDGIKFLTLEKLKTSYKKSKNCETLIKNQIKLKKLKLLGEPLGPEFFEEICKLSELEMLEFKVNDDSLTENWENLEKLEKLKKLKLNTILKKFHSLKNFLNLRVVHWSF